MRIEDIMDCQGCEHLRFYSGNVGGDPDQCYPSETVCEIGAWDGEPCARVLGAIRDRINDGYLETEHGQFRTGDSLQDGQRDDDLPEDFRVFDFSAAPFYWVPYNYATEYIQAYQDEKEIFYAWFM